MVISKNFKLEEGQLPGIPWTNSEGKQILYIDGPLDKFPPKVDVILSRSCPLSFSPCIMREDEEDYESYMERLATRQYLNTVLKEVVTSYWFFPSPDGISYSGHIGNLLYRALVEGEEVEI